MSFFLFNGEWYNGRPINTGEYIFLDVSTGGLLLLVFYQYRNCDIYGLY